MIGSVDAGVGELCPKTQTCYQINTVKDLCIFSEVSVQYPGVQKMGAGA